MDKRKDINLNKNRSGLRRTERAQEKVNLLQQMLIEDPRISARKDVLDISKSTFIRITKRDLKWHPNTMHVRNEINHSK